MEIRIKKTTPVRIKASSAFGVVKLSEKESVAFGSQEYETEAYEKSEPYILIDATAIFGKLEVVEE